jgi:2-polyprenyl-6-methoxyphenol hydroxylase-like FAD-dependent oxidoreductase
MAAVERVLIVGAGIGGLAMAIALRERGIAVDVVELEARVLGVGITLTGTTLRVLDMVGLATAAAQQGFGFDFFLVSDGAANCRPRTRCHLPVRACRPRSELSALCLPAS